MADTAALERRDTRHPRRRRARLTWAAMAAAVAVIWAAALPSAADDQPGAAAATASATPSAAPAAGSEAAAAPARRRNHGQAATIDTRVNLMARKLDLTATQQAQLRKLLLDQREQVLRLWNDTSMAPPNRVRATQLISDRTADQIRALLNEEQRKKYFPPKHAPDRPQQGNGVEDWMKRTSAG